jgi:acetolactate synthase regulatory subunit
VRAYDVTLRMDREALSADALERRLERVRQVIKSEGFHISELRVKGADDGERRELVPAGGPRG